MHFAALVDRVRLANAAAAAGLVIHASVATCAELIRSRTESRSCAQS